MTKILSTINKLTEIDNILNYIDGILVGIKALSINFSNYFALEEILELENKTDKEIFVSLNKNMHNEDLKQLEKVLKKVNHKKIKIIFYDVAVLHMAKRLNIDNDLIWGQEHLATNAETIDFYKQNGSKYTFLSSEITLDEILEIIENNKSVVVQVFGYIPIFTSKRHLVKNYLEFFNIKDNSKINYLLYKNDKYPIVDSKNGATTYSAYVLNAIEESLIYKEKGVSYLLLNSFNIEESKYSNILKMFKDVNIDNVFKYEKIINELLITDKAFLYKESNYRVKKDEK